MWFDGEPLPPVELNPDKCTYMLRHAANLNLHYYAGLPIKASLEFLMYFALNYPNFLETEGH